jgi:FYVE zinc finger
VSDTLTIFFCGTCASSLDAINHDIYHSGELVSTLYQNCSGISYIDKVIFDGPGSGNLRENEKWIESDHRWGISGVATGAGWENNVKAAITVALAHVNIGTYVNRKGQKVKEEHLPYWVPDMQRQECQACGKGFGTWTRKHHCRRCGEIFCSACLPKDMDIKHVITDKYTLPNANAYIALKPGTAKVCKICSTKKEDDFVKQLNQKDQINIVDKQSQIQLWRNAIAEHRIKQPLTTINVIGWSRGGVTCIMFANACAETEGLEKIQVNLFTLDPVPGYGSGGKDEHRCNLKSNVKNYATVIQMDEVSRAFAPVIPQTDVTTMCHYITMPGRHGTGVGNAALDGNKRKKGDLEGKTWKELFDLEGTPLTLEEPGEVTRAIVEKFLEHWGTELDNKLELHAMKRFEIYEKMMKKEAQFRAQRKVSYTVGCQGSIFGPNCRSVLVGGGYKPMNEIERLQSGFFINTDHAAIGLMLFPELENIYSKEVANRRPKKSEDIHQLQQNLCNKLDKIPQFEEIAPVLYGCILLRASKYWEGMVMIHNLQAAGFM